MTNANPALIPHALAHYMNTQHTTHTRTYSVQFVDIVAFSQSVATMGKIVIVAACDSTFEGKPFGDVLNLVPCAEKVDKLSAICVYCQHDASFSARLSDETDLEVIGGDDKYAAVCRSCFNSRFNLPHSSP